jgi:hypothetical protein
MILILAAGMDFRNRLPGKAELIGWHPVERLSARNLGIQAGSPSMAQAGVSIRGGPPLFSRIKMMA